MGRDCCDESILISNSMEQVYDFATWRMYHRITSARRFQEKITPVISHGCLPSTKTKLPNCLPSTKTKLTKECTPQQSHELSPQQHPSRKEIPLLDGEVFHLDI